MPEIADFFNSVGVPTACLVYFMWFNNDTMKKFTEQMKQANDLTREILIKLEHARYL